MATPAPASALASCLVFDAPGCTGLLTTVKNIYKAEVAQVSTLTGEPIPACSVGDTVPAQDIAHCQFMTNNLLQTKYGGNAAFTSWVTGVRYEETGPLATTTIVNSSPAVSNAGGEGKVLVTQKVTILNTGAGPVSVGGAYDAGSCTPNDSCHGLRLDFTSGSINHPNNTSGVADDFSGAVNVYSFSPRTQPTGSKMMRMLVIRQAASSNNGLDAPVLNSVSYHVGSDVAFLDESPKGSARFPGASHSFGIALNAPGYAADLSGGFTDYNSQSSGTFTAPTNSPTYDTFFERGDQNSWCNDPLVNESGVMVEGPRSSDQGALAVSATMQTGVARGYCA